MTPLRALFWIISTMFLLVGVYIFLNHKAKQAAVAAISSFEECGKYFPIMESYPEQCRTPDGRLFINDVAEPIFPPQTLDDRIRVTVPTQGATIHSPLTIQGVARGPWYFEGSFPVKLLDKDGVILAETHAQAEGEWMTEDFVPFTATLTFPATTTGTGTLVLERDNPSGLTENDAEIQVPVLW